MAVAYYNLGKLDKAKANFEISMQLLVDVKNDMAELADLKAANFYYLYLLSDCDDKFAYLAVSQFEKAINEYPDYEHKLNLYLYLATLYEYQKNYDKAASICIDALSIADNDIQKANIYHTLASISQSKKEFLEAEKYYYKSLEFAEKDKSLYSKIYFDLGRLFIEKGDKGKATEALENALKFKQDSPFLKHRNDYVKEIRGYLREQRTTVLFKKKNEDAKRHK